MPLCTESETLGVLTVTRVLNAREPMTDADLELLCDLGELATRSLANSRLHRDLADATALFETAFRSAPIGMALVSITDDPGRIVRVNDAMTMATGHSGHELLSMHVTALFPAHSAIALPPTCGLPLPVGRSHRRPSAPCSGATGPR